MTDNPGSPAWSIPRDEYEQLRRLADVENTIRENAAARTLEASTIGAGGLRVKGGGSITVEAPGTIQLSGGAFSAGTIAATTTLSAGTTLTVGTNATVGGSLTAGNVASTGPVSGNTGSFSGAVTGSTGNFPSRMNCLDSYSRPLTYGGNYNVLYVHQDGTYGIVPSSRRYKQDIKTATIPDLRKTLAVFRVVQFRYISAVEHIGKEAAVEWGLIAEEVHALGLHWLVTYDEEGAPAGIRHERMALLAILAAQDLQVQMNAQQAQIDDLRLSVEKLAL